MLSARYDRPSGVVPADMVQSFIAQGRRVAELGERLDRLHFVREAVSDASTGVGTRTNTSDLILQGTVSATLPCPGDERAPRAAGEDAGDDAGLLHLRFGVENSMLQRGFEGTAERCRFPVASPVDFLQSIVFTGALTGDLGRDIAIGEHAADILLKLSDVAGQWQSSVGNVAFRESSYHFRVTEDDALELLLDPTSLGLPDVGSVVFVVRADGSFGLRESRGEWTCGAGGEACLLRG